MKHSAATLDNHQVNPKWGMLMVFLLSLMLTMSAFYRVFVNGEGSILWLLACVIASLPLCFLVQSIRNWWVYALVTLVLMFLSGTECFFIIAYFDFIRAGNMMSVFSTTTRESSNFAANNVGNFMYELPVIFLEIILLIFKHRTKGLSRQMLKGAAISLLLLLALLPFHQVTQNPPYNLLSQAATTIRLYHDQNSLVPQSADFQFHATRDSVDVCERETYVYVVGESMRYQNISQSGYERNTTPLTSTMPSLVSFSNYYSTATLTLFSVPVMISRATARNFNRCYRERGILQVFHECGFKTFVISNKKFLSYKPCFTQGADSVYTIAQEALIPHLIDSLSSCYPRTFFVVQPLQSHSYYSNFTPEFDRYHPNLVSDSQSKSDQLFLNAYDNCILYADYILTRIIESINRPDTRAAMLFASDHGEILSMKGHRRGNSLTPGPEEYHVPLFFWSGEEWNTHYPQKRQAIMENANQPTNADCLFYTVCDMAGIQLPDSLSEPTWNLLSNQFKPHPRTIKLPNGAVKKLD